MSIVLMVAVGMISTATYVGGQSLEGCDEFVEEEGLEPNVGLAFDNPFTQQMPSPRYEINNFEVSPDGRWLVYGAGWERGVPTTIVRDLLTGRTRDLGYYSESFQWDTSSSICEMHRLGHPGGYYYNVYADSVYVRWESGFCEDVGACFLILRWAPDNHFYGYCHGLQRARLDSSEAKGCIFIEPVDSAGVVPFFPRGTMSWSVTYFQDSEIEGVNELTDTIEGFAVIDSLDWSTKRLIPLYLSSFDATGSWEFSQLNSWASNAQASYYYSMGASSTGDVYYFLGFRHKGEYLDRAAPFRPHELEARAASGWYRFDTAGKGGVQLARLWSNLGISVTRDGDIFYGRMMPDSTVAIWKMDKCGLSKTRIVGWQEHPAPNSVGYPIQGIEESGEEFRVSVAIYGNELQISIEALGVADRTLYLVDLFGRKQIKGIIRHDESVFRHSIVGFPVGLYFVIVEDGERIVSVPTIIP